MIKMFEFLLESSPVIALLIGIVFYVLNLKIKHLESGQNDLKEDIKEIRKLLFEGAGTTIKKVSKNGN